VKAVGTSSFSVSLFDALYLFIVNQREERGNAYEHKQILVIGAKVSK
jgi:hypothetical protein